MNKKIFWFFLLLVCLLGLFLRLRNIGNVPLPGQSQDEYSNAWVGMSILQSGVPVGMSGLTGNRNELRVYVNTDRIFQGSAGGDATTIDYPWFDHPPVVGLITGGFAYVKGARVFEDVRAAVIRKPAVFFSILTIMLIGLLGAELFSPMVGLIGALFYAISPLTTVMNRMVQAENYFTPLALFGLYGLFKFSQSKAKAWWYLGTITLMLGVLMKLSSVAFVIAALFLLKKTNKQNWPWITTGVFVLAAVSWWIVWGMALDSGAFWAVLLGNSQRAYGIGYQAVSDLLTTVKVTGTKTITDGWVLLSFLGFVTLMVSKEKNKQWIIIPVICYLAIYLFLGSQSYGWYRLPFFPLTFIALGYLTVTIFKQAELGGVLLSLIPLGISASRVIPTTGTWLAAWRIIPLLMMAVGYFVANKNLSRFFLGLVLTAAIVVSVIYNLKIDISFWYQLS